MWKAKGPVWFARHTPVSSLRMKGRIIDLHSPIPRCPRSGHKLGSEEKRSKGFKHARGPRGYTCNKRKHRTPSSYLTERPATDPPPSQRSPTGRGADRQAQGSRRAMHARARRAKISAPSCFFFYPCSGSFWRGVEGGAGGIPDSYYRLPLSRAACAIQNRSVPESKTWTWMTRSLIG